MSNQKQIYIILILLLFAVTQTQAAVIDTTKVRTTQKIKKTTSEIIADIPAEIIKFPFYFLEFTAKQISFNPPGKQLISWIGTPQPARFYYPVVGYNSSAGMKFGVGFKFQNVYSSKDYIKSKFYYSTNEYLSYKIHTSSENIIKKDIGLDFYFRYKQRTREDFYGITNRSRADLIANYNLENMEVNISLLFNKIPNTNISTLVGYTGTTLRDGEDPDLIGELDSIVKIPDYLLGDESLDDSKFFVYGFVFEHDDRNNIGQPSHGSHLISRFMRYQGIDISEDRNFSIASIDLRNYLQIWKKRIIALRFAAKKMSNFDESKGAMPIYLLSSLGGDEYLRGYSEGRFVDNDFALFSIEYRYPVYDILDLFIFNDQARVFGNITDEKFFTEWKSSFGGGLRVWNEKEVQAIIQVAKSNESTKFYFEMEAVW